MLGQKKQDTLGFKVVGEVTNLGPANANSVTVSATFYDLDHKVVDTDYAFTNLETIPPGKKASFEISFSRRCRYSIFYCLSRRRVCR